MTHIDPDYDEQHVREQCSERVDLDYMLCGCASSDAYAKNKDHWEQNAKKCFTTRPASGCPGGPRGGGELRALCADVGAALYTWHLAECPSGPLLWDIKFYHHDHHH
ncbi:hypothetical protein V5799_003665 [Amblyomma americanum]|uniref:Uncharacterized protein n=1 Tax=Amblyomma americanum TaxID=6943 RepID=A0AAQ4D8B3_AMBAM